MTQISETGRLDEGAVQKLAARVRGAVLRPGSAGYDTARTLYNAMIDKRPGVIVRCTGVADVVAAVQFARETERIPSSPS